jgi:1,4-alpha-glucan branching enzyme
MLKKRFVKSRQVWKVTFELAKHELPEGLEADSVHLVGDFNDWDTTGMSMKRGRGGAYRTIVEFEPGQEVQFRYLVNGEHWCNDWGADAYVPGGVGGDNCVVKLSADGF